MNLVHDRFYPEKSLTGVVIDAAHEVFRQLGRGFFEKVYENSLHVELVARGISCVQQESLAVSYRGQIVGEYFADLVVERKLVVKLEVASSWDGSFDATLQNHLRASGHEVGLIFNFGAPALQYKRMIWTTCSTKSSRGRCADL